MAVRIPVFTKRAKRALAGHPKLFLFDTGVFRTVRPRGPLDRPEEIDGAALETVVFQQLRALNEYHRFGYQIYYWRTRGRHEVDFVLYGERGIRAFEIKRARKLRGADFAGLRAFLEDYGDMVDEVYLLYGGDRAMRQGKIRLLPLEQWLPRLRELLA